MQRMLISFNDITRRKRAEEALAAREAEVRHIIDAVHDILTRSTLDGRLLWASPALERTLGWRPDDFTGKRLGNIVHPDDRAQVFGALDGLKPGATVEFGMRVRTRSGGTRHLSCKGTVVVGSTENLAPELVLSSRDVSEEVAAKQAIELALDRAETARQAKSHFLASMSHEIRTPLNGVIGMISLLLDTPLSRAQRNYAEVVQSSGNSLMEVVNDILDLSKIESGTLTLRPVDVELMRIIEVSLDPVTASASLKGLQIGYLLDPDVPKHIRVDATRLRQVLVNLIGNAVKFTETGHVLINVKVLFSQGPIHTLQFAVEDTGPGIAAEHLDTIFRRFEQSPTRTPQPGTGLGLSICRQLVQLMGGEINLTSTLGTGSVFVFDLPVLSILPPDVSSLPRCLEGRHALIIDESPTSRGILESICLSVAMTTTSPLSTKEAMRWLYAGHPCDVALVDLDSECESAHCLVQEILAARPTLPLVVFSSLRSPVDVPVALAQLVKPIKHTVLIEALNRHFGCEGSNEAPQTTRELAPLRVLLAEDNPVNRLVGLGLLSRLGIQADIARTGVEAIERVESQPYDVILMDMQMPEMDGLESTRRLRAAGHTLWIVALTASTDVVDRIACTEAGMDDFLTKPVTREGLEAALERARTSKRRAAPKSPRDRGSRE